MWLLLAQVEQMFDKAEQESKELASKKQIIENDKEKIHKVHSPSSHPLVILPRSLC
jgi:hypothetical protein